MPTVVVVEDDVDLSRLVATHLEKGFSATVHQFLLGKVALEHIAKSELPDVVVTDISLPDISGFEVCSLLRAEPRTKRLPVLVISGRTGLDDYARAREVGADAYLDKPFRKKQFIQEIERLLAKGTK